MNDKVNKRRDFLKQVTLGSIGVFSADNLVSGKQPDEKKLNIVCVGAHPGDPEFGCGGTLAKYSDAGHNVTLLYLTRGEASDPKKTHAEMAKSRTAETVASCKILKATAVYMGQIDGETVLNKEANGKMTELIKSLKPDVIFTHWPLDTHPDHQVAALLTLNAWQYTGRKAHLYFYEVDTGGQTMAFTPTDYVDISDVHERKKQVMFTHETQDPMSVYEEYFKPMEEFRGLEAGVKVAEAFIVFKPNGEKAKIVGL